MIVLRYTWGYTIWRPISPHFVKVTVTVEFHCHQKGRDFYDGEDQAFLQCSKIKGSGLFLITFFCYSEVQNIVRKSLYQESKNKVGFPNSQPCGAESSTGIGDLWQKAKHALLPEGSGRFLWGDRNSCWGLGSQTRLNRKSRETSPASFSLPKSEGVSLLDRWRGFVVHSIKGSWLGFLIVSKMSIA